MCSGVCGRTPRIEFTNAHLVAEQGTIPIPNENCPLIAFFSPISTVPFRCLQKPRWSFSAGNFSVSATCSSKKLCTVASIIFRGVTHTVLEVFRAVFREGGVPTSFRAFSLAIHAISRAAEVSRHSRLLAAMAWFSWGASTFTASRMTMVKTSATSYCWSDATSQRRQVLYGRTGVGQARLPGVHAKLVYIIEPPEPSSLTRSPSGAEKRVTAQRQIMQQIIRPNRPLTPYT